MKLAKMRTITTQLSALLLLFCVTWAGTAHAQETTVAIPAVSAEAGESVQVPVNVDAFNDIGAVTLVITYDSDVLSFNGLENAARSQFEANVPSDGELRISWFDQSGSNPIDLGSGKLLDMNFAYSSGATTLDFDEAQSEIADAQATPIAVTYESGRVASTIGEIALGSATDASLGQTVTVPVTAQGFTPGIDASLDASQSLANGGAGSGTSPGSGSATFTVNLTDGSISSIDYEITVSGLDFSEVTDAVDSTDALDDDVIGLHIHNAARAEQGGIVFGIIGSPSQGGTLDPSLTDDTDRSVTVDGDQVTISGDWDTDEATSPADFASDILGAAQGEDLPLYLNVHTSGNQAGEIRGQLQGVPSVGSLSLSVGFDSDAVQFESLNDQSGLGLSAGTPEDGVVSIGGFNTDGVNLSGEIAQLEFSYLGGETALAFADSEVTNPAGDVLNTQFTDGSIAGVAPEISFPSVNAVLDDTISVPVQVDNLANVGAVSLSIEFNGAVLSFVGSANNNFGEDLQIDNPSAGVLNVGGFDTNGSDLTDQLVELQFAATASGSSPLTFDVANSEVTNPAGTAFNVAFTNGDVTVTEGLILGDVNANGSVDAGDATLVLRSLVDAVSLSSAQQEAADVDGDGEPTAADASFILQFVVGSIDQFPAQASASAKTGDRASGVLELGTPIPQDGQNQFVVPVQLTDVDGTLTATELSLSYDDSAIDIGAVQTLFPSEWTAVHNVKDGEGVVKLAAAGTSSLGEGTIARITVTSFDGTRPAFRGEGRLNAQTSQSIAATPTAQAPQRVTLSPSYPNPFTSSTTIRYGLPDDTKVTLEVFNILGQKVATLVNGKQSAGRHEVMFDASNLSSGTYLYRVEAGGVTKSGRMTVVK